MATVSAVDPRIALAGGPAGIEREAEHPDPRRIAIRDPLDPVLALPSDRERVLRTSPRIVPGFMPTGSASFLFERYGLTAPGIAETAHAAMAARPR